MAVDAGVGATEPVICPSIAMKSTLMLEGAAGDDEAGAAATGVGVLATGIGLPASATLDGMICLLLGSSAGLALGALVAFALLAPLDHMTLFGVPPLDHVAQRFGTFQGVLPL